MMQANPTPVSKVRFNFGVDLLLVKSNITNPKPPILKRKLDAKPSIMYCPLTRYGINATCLRIYFKLYCLKMKLLKLKVFSKSNS